jgi:hypothetical protein
MPPPLRADDEESVAMGVMGTIGMEVRISSGLS